MKNLFSCLGGSARIALLILPLYTYAQTQTLESGEREAGDQFGHVVAASGGVAVIGAPFEDRNNSSDAGSAYVFERGNGGVWARTATLRSNDGDRRDQFGYSAAVSSDALVVVGARRHDGTESDSGAVYVFQRDGGGWTQAARLIANDGSPSDEFGTAVAIDDGTIVAGAPRADVRRGVAYVFDREGDDARRWTQRIKLVPNDPQSGASDTFGQSVAISGDTIVVGAPGANGNDTNAGAAYVFERNAGGPNAWRQVAKLTANDGAVSDALGWSVAFSGDTIIVGSNKGTLGAVDAAYVFSRNEGGENEWGQVAKLRPNNGAAGDQFSYSVALEGGLAAFGARSDDERDTDSGAAYLFQEDAGLWLQEEKYTDAEADSEDFLGTGVAIGEGAVLVGIPGDDEVGENSGKVLVFALPEGPSDTLFTSSFEAPDNGS